VIGKNGTGKSTLLRLVAGVLIQDEGKIHVRGNVAPLLELSAGFSNDLTGRENVRLVGSLHGLSPTYMKQHFDEIVEFAGEQVQRAIDTPVRHYSSGMKVRLGFAVISHLQHPILLMDEVMAVGDAEFRKKCYDTIERMLGEGRTLVLVSHNESDLTRFCTRGLYFDAGNLRIDGTVREALDAYNNVVRT
jgi:ABC-2 type transport system ATP-binding protein